MRPTFSLAVLPLVGLGCSAGVDDKNHLGNTCGRVQLGRLRIHHSSGCSYFG